MITVGLHVNSVNLNHLRAATKKLEAFDMI